MLPLGFFRVPGFIGANTVAGLMNLVVLGTIFVLTLYLQVVRGYPALLAGFHTLPMFAPLSALAPLGGRLTARLGPRLPMQAGSRLESLGWPSWAAWRRARITSRAYFHLSRIIHERLRKLSRECAMNFVPDVQKPGACGLSSAAL
jgi:hypothetical protein